MMDKKKWLTYWKKSLSDSLKADIEIEKLRYFEIENFIINSQTIEQIENINELIDFEEQRINNKNGVFIRTSNKWIKLEFIQILLSPFKIMPTPEHLVFLRDSNSKFPFWYYAIVDRNGTLSIPEEISPIFQRKYLEPLANDKTEFIFSTVEKVDKAIATGKEKYESFDEYINYVKNTFNLVTDQYINDYKTEGYNIIQNGIVLLPDENINASIAIIHLYDKILKEKNIPALLDSFINLTTNTNKHILSVPELIDVNFLHLGQMGFDFPLSISQRKCLYTFLQANDKVFAVNGPPGTGKTTLLQTIVANKIVETAINGDNPPIILACSTNNQAVTNIIDSFSKSNTREGKLQGRWLPEIDGYATYLPSVPSEKQPEKRKQKLKEWESKKWNFRDIANYIGFFSRVENNNYLSQAKDFFLTKASAYLNSKFLDISDINKKLQTEIISIKSSLNNASKKWKEYLAAENLFTSSYCNENIEQKRYYFDNILNSLTFEIDISNLVKSEEKIIRYFNNESFFRKLFCSIGLKSALNNRASELRIILRDSSITEINASHLTKNEILDLIDSKIKIAKKIIKTIAEWNKWKQENSIKGNPPKNDTEYCGFENLKIEWFKSQDINLSEPNCFYDELDVTLRHKAFQLALHYWEGKWLLRLEEDLKDADFNKKGINAVKKRWNRQSMLTPCFVSTFYMAPKFFSYTPQLLKNDAGGLIDDKNPLLGYIDLLIVDEAGQVSPEVGVATFSLAKQAIIVGDTKQIEPVWSISNKVDIGNLKGEALIKNFEDLIYEREYDPKGFLASTGSIMKMAQNACYYKENGLSEKGVSLVEHRRCYNEIINYCNILAYNGQLKPLKGKAGEDNLFPPMCCIHVEGNSIVNTSTSRYNLNEVTAIVDWLTKNKQKIEKKYGKLEDAVGIVTPFVGQKNNLRYALKKAGFDVNLMKLGTVHALQGAERHIILFSMVYGKGDSGTMFFDRDNKPNMLNVAVSRAKDSFIVFANTQILDKNAKTPSGILANHLTCI